MFNKEEFPKREATSKLNDAIHVMSSPKDKERRKYKTYKERAQYLSFINPTRASAYFAISDFFGEYEIPPIPKKTKTKSHAQ